MELQFTLNYLVLHAKRPENYSRNEVTKKKKKLCFMGGWTFQVGWVSQNFFLK